MINGCIVLLHGSSFKCFLSYLKIANLWIVKFMVGLVLCMKKLIGVDGCMTRIVGSFKLLTSEAMQ